MSVGWLTLNSVCVSLGCFIFLCNEMDIQASFIGIFWVNFVMLVNLFLKFLKLSLRRSIYLSRENTSNVKK